MNARPQTPPYDVIVLAGGTSQRFGADKLAALVDGTPMLERVLAAASGARTVVAVGPSRAIDAEVVWCREQPPGSGPANGIVAGLDVCTAPYVVVLAGDLPYVTGDTVARLLAGVVHDTAVDGVQLVHDGRPQLLCSAWHRESLAAAVQQRPDWSDTSVGALLSPLVFGRVAGAGREGADVDRPEDLLSEA